MESQSQTGQERRLSPRVHAAYAAKVFDRRADRYHPAQTCDLSASGALLKVQRSMPIHKGDLLDVTITTDDETSRVLALEDFMPARVVRVTAIDRFSQAIAVQFNAAADMPAQQADNPIIETHVMPNRERLAA